MFKRFRSVLSGTGAGYKTSDIGPQLKEDEYRITILGGGGAGKSALVINFVTGNQFRAYDPTVEDSYRKSVQIGEVTLLFDVLDTAGQSEFQSMTEGWIRHSKGIILCFDLVRHKCFEQIESLFEQVMRFKGDQCSEENPQPIVVVGTKLDCVEDGKMERKVSRKEVLEQIDTWTTSHPAVIGYYEVCSFDQKHSEAPFLGLAAMMCGMPSNIIQGWQPLPPYKIGRLMNYKIARTAIDDDRPYKAKSETDSDATSGAGTATSTKTDESKEETKEETTDLTAKSSPESNKMIKSLHVKVTAMDTKIDTLSKQMELLTSAVEKLTKRLDQKPQSLN